MKEIKTYISEVFGEKIINQILIDESYSSSVIAKLAKDHDFGLLVARNKQFNIQYKDGTGDSIMIVRSQNRREVPGIDSVKDDEIICILSEDGDKVNDKEAFKKLDEYFYNQNGLTYKHIKDMFKNKNNIDDFLKEIFPLCMVVTFINSDKLHCKKYCSMNLSFPNEWNFANNVKEVIFLNAKASEKLSNKFAEVIKREKNHDEDRNTDVSNKDKLKELRKKTDKLFDKKLDAIKKWSEENKELVQSVKSPIELWGKPEYAEFFVKTFNLYVHLQKIKSVTTTGSSFDSCIWRFAAYVTQYIFELVNGGRHDWYVEELQEEYYFSIRYMRFVLQHDTKAAAETDKEMHDESGQFKEKCKNELKQTNEYIIKALKDYIR